MTQTKVGECYKSEKKEVTQKRGKNSSKIFVCRTAVAASVSQVLLLLFKKKSGNLFTVVTPNSSKRVAQSSLIRCHVDEIKRNCQGASLEREERTLIQSKAQPVLFRNQIRPK